MPLIYHLCTALIYCHMYISHGAVGQFQHHILLNTTSIIYRLYLTGFVKIHPNPSPNHTGTEIHFIGEH